MLDTLLSSESINDASDRIVGEPGGVFSHVRNEAAFVDRIALSVWGEPHYEFRDVIVTVNLAIGGADAIYARAMHGIILLTGNPFELKYGVMKPYRRFPPYRLIARSKETLLTGIQISALLKSLFYRIARAYVSELEITFDITPVKGFSSEQQIFTRARNRFAREDAAGRRTFYAGRRKATWQFKNYRKSPHAPHVDRFEITLRRAFLRRHRITSLPHVLRLKDFDFSPMLSFRDLSRPAFNRVLNQLPDSWQRRAMLDLSRRKPLQFLSQTLTRQGISTDGLFLVSKVERRLRAMQKQFLW